MVNMIDSYNKLSKKDIEDFEGDNEVKLTPNYRDFLLKWNGGAPVPETFMISDEEGPSVINYFYNIGGSNNNIEVYLDILDLRIPKGVIPIGDDPGGNVILLGTVEPYYDHIYFWDHENEPDLEEPDMSNMYFLANNIWEFLDSLYEDDFDEV